MRKIFFLIIALVYGLIFFVLSASANNSTPSGQTPPTFNREVVRIFQNNCQVCHHPGAIAPFSLMTYADAAPRAQRIKQATQERRMPPWKPADNCGQFQGVRRLSDKDIDILARWADADPPAPEGDPADLPKPLEFPDGWTLGEPDLIMDSGADYLPDPALTDDYHCFTMATNFTENKYLSAIDIQPGNRRIVHHVLLFLDPKGESADREEGYTCFGGPDIRGRFEILGGWAPGAQARFLPDGVGQLVPAGERTRIIMQVHYHPQGEPEADRTKLGLYFSDGPVDRGFYMMPIYNTRFRIPRNDNHYRVHTQVPPLQDDLHGLSVAPHMHLLGKEIELKANLPDGQTQCLINIDDWDFNWQGFYFFAKAISLPKGTTIDMTAYYDNSEGNPRNPHSPPQDVTWGERTTDEMFLAFLGITVDGQKLGDPSWKMSPQLEDLLQPVSIMGTPVDAHRNNNHEESNHSSHH